MLGAVLAPGFSKTAGSRPGHREAGRHGKDELAIAIFGRSVAHDFCESPAESAEAAKPNVEADVSDTSRGLPEQEHRALHPPALKVTVRSLAERRLEGPDEVGLGYVSDARKTYEIQRLRVSAIHRIAGSKHAAIQL